MPSGIAKYRNKHAIAAKLFTLGRKRPPTVVQTILQAELGSGKNTLTSLSLSYTSQSPDSESIIFTIVVNGE